MRASWRRVVPFILAGLLLWNLAHAIVTGGRGPWLLVALVALGLAVSFWLRDQAAGRW